MRVVVMNILLAGAFIWISSLFSVEILADCIDSKQYVTPNIGLQHSFWQGIGDDITECAAMCLRRTLCKSINYDTSSKLCELNSGLRSNTPTKSGKYLVYSEIDNWPKKALDSHCHHRPCAHDQVCIPGSFLASAKTDSNGCTYSCMFAGSVVCPMPPFGVSNGRTVGSVNVLKCSKGYVGGGSAECLKTKEWDKDLTCQAILGHSCKNNASICAEINGVCSKEEKCVCGPNKIYDRATQQCVTECQPITNVSGAIVVGTGKVRSYQCNDGLKPYPGGGNGTITCSDVTGMWEPTGFKCYGIRLVRPNISSAPENTNPASRNKTEGYLEMFLEGQWNNIDIDHWDWKVTKVACKEINESYVYGGTFHDRWLGRQNNNPAYNSTLKSKKLKDIKCIGSEHSLTNCTPFKVENGNHDNDVALTCFETDVTVPFEHVGFSNGSVMDFQSGATKGFLLVKYGGRVGAVCYDGWDDTSTLVAKKGMNSVTCTKKDDEDKLNGWTIFVGNIKCNGDEPHLFFCKNSGWNYDSDCGNKIVFIEC